MTHQMLKKSYLDDDLAWPVKQKIFLGWVYFNEFITPKIPANINGIEETSKKWTIDRSVSYHCRSLKGLMQMEGKPRLIRERKWKAICVYLYIYKYIYLEWKRTFATLIANIVINIYPSLFYQYWFHAEWNLFWNSEVSIFMQCSKCISQVSPIMKSGLVNLLIIELLVNFALTKLGLDSSLFIM